MPAPYAVIDLETTGFRTSDRILEIGVVLLDERARIQGRWESLIQPDRDIPNTEIHGIAAGDVATAPRFADIAVEVAELIAGRILIAHNAPFDMAFLVAEFARVGVELHVQSHHLCTMQLAAQLLPGSPRKLSDCLVVIGDDNEAPHNALADAEATARLFAVLLPMIRGHQLPRPLPGAPGGVDKRSAALPRGARREAPGEWLRRISAGLPGTGDTDRDAYRALLASALADDALSATEVEYLLSCARDLGMSREDVTEEHESYLRQMAVEAWADGVVTDAEREVIHSVAASLGVTSGIDELLREPLEGPGRERIQLRPGDRITFTGATELPREVWAERARQAGLEVGGVSRDSVLLIAADPDSRSGKARRAAELGVPVVSEPVFAALLRGLEITQPAETGAVEAELLAAFPWLGDLEEPVTGPQMVAREWITRHPEAPLHDISPRLSPGELPETLDTRRAPIRLWLELHPEPLSASVLALNDVRGVGRHRLNEIVQKVAIAALDAVADTEAVEPVASGAGLADALYETAEQPPELPAQLRTLWQWLALSGATFDLEGAPESVRTAALDTVELPGLVDAVEDLVTGAQAELLALGAGDPRNAVIVEQRLFGDATLEELGAVLGVTRERVRQLELPLRARAADPGPAGALILAALRRRFLPFTRVEEILATIPELDADSPYGGTLLGALSTLGAGVEIEGQWWQQEGTGALLDEALAGAADEHGIVVPGEVAEQLGVPTEVLLDRLRDSSRDDLEHEGLLLTANGSYPDRAAAILHLAGAPMSSAELITQLPGGNPRSLANALSADERFHRSAQDTWSLRAWGNEEFTTVAEHIGRRIDANDGTYPLAELLAQAPDLRISESTIRAYVATPEFTLTDGMVTRSEEPAENNSSPEESRALFWRDGAWQLLLTVNRDHLRGSGFPVPRGIAALLGVPFLGKVELPSTEGVQTVSFGRTNVSCSTIRRFLPPLEVAEGDRIWLRFAPEGFGVSRATPAATGGDAARALLNAIGFDDRDTPDTALAVLNTAIDLRADAPLRRTVARLRHRGEEELIDLVRAASDAWVPGH